MTPPEETLELPCGVHKLIADVAILDRGRVLMVKYADASRYDGQRGWFLPNDFLQPVEHPSNAARRIAREQASLEIPEPRLDHIESFGNGAWHITFHHVVRLRGRPALTPGENVTALGWFDLKKPPPRASVAHQGWALDVLKRIAAGRTR